jgi:beta-1,4-mannosyltransferase
MNTAYVSPFTNETNDYINQVKAVLAANGMSVQPFSFKTLASPRALGLFSKRNLILVHWLESRAFTEGRTGARVSLFGLLQVLIYLAVLAVARARFVYFVHDHAVHDLQGWRRQFSVWLIRCLSALADVRVVHDPSHCNTYRAVYLPHPLYHDRVPERIAPRQMTGVFRVGALGAVRPYKRIEHIAACWPAGPELVVRGRCDLAYEREIRAAMAAQGPGVHIDFQPGFLSREAFDTAMASLDALILPHASDSMLVSGAFFEAIGAVPFIIARETPFTRWASQQFEGVLTFTTDAEMLACVAEAQRRRDTLPPLAQQAQKANELFGFGACVRGYRQLLGVS